MSTACTIIVDLVICCWLHIRSADQRALSAAEFIENTRAAEFIENTRVKSGEALPSGLINWNHLEFIEYYTNPILAALSTTARTYPWHKGSTSAAELLM